MKKITEPFDLDKYNNQSGYKAEFQNENAYTFPAKIIYTKCKGTHPIVAVISLFPNTEEVLNFTLEGQFSNNNCTSHLCLVKYEFEVGDIVTFPLMKEERVVGKVKRVEEDNIVVECDETEYQLFDKSRVRKATTEEIVLFEYMSGNRSKFEVLEFLCQKRDDFNFNWKPNYTAEDTKYSITAREYTLVKDVTFNYHHIFAFKIKDTRDKFFDKYYDLLKIIIEFL